MLIGQILFPGVTIKDQLHRIMVMTGAPSP